MKQKIICLLACIILILAFISNASLVLAKTKPVQLRKPTDGYWDCIYYGKYYQSSTAKKEKIMWRVLSVSGNNAFLISDQIIDCQPFDKSGNCNDWNDSSIRQWLNNDFLNNAFNEREREGINTTIVKNENYAMPDSITEDKIYLLSWEELENTKYGFSTTKSGLHKPENMAQCTEYAKKRGVRSKDRWWWLRNCNNEVWRYSAMYVSSFSGTTGIAGYDSDYIGVRPVMNIDLSKKSWSYAGSFAVCPTQFSSLRYSMGSAVKDLKVNFKVKKKTKKYSLGGRTYYKGYLVCPKRKKSQMTEYMIWYSTNKKVSKKNHQFESGNSTTLVQTLYKLEKGKTYYIKLRPYTQYGNKRVYGKWSGIKKLKV